MLGNITGWHLLILLAVVLLLFGATKLPALAKSMGQSARVFRREITAKDDGDVGSSPASDAATPPATPSWAPRDVPSLGR